MTSPISLIVTAVAPVDDVRLARTPELAREADSALLLVDLGLGRNRLGASALAQVHGVLGAEPPDVDDPARLRAFFGVIQGLLRQGLLLAYHDRSDGGLFACLCEMAFAGGTGLEVELDDAARESDRQALQRGARGRPAGAPPRSRERARGLRRGGSRRGAVGDRRSLRAASAS